MDKLFLCKQDNHTIYCRLYFVWTDVKPESSNCLSCVVRTTERRFAIGSSIVCLIIVAVYWTATWMFHTDNQAVFVKACMNPNGNFIIGFGKWWAFCGVIAGTHGLGIALCASLFIWLSLQQSETTLIRTKVCRGCFDNL